MLFVGYSQIFMNPLIDTPFINLLFTLRPCRREELESAYDDFVRTVIEVCDNTTDYKLLFRILTHTQVRLEMLYPSRTRVKSNAGEVSASRYIVAAKRIVESELSLLNERVVHPSLFQPPRKNDIPDLFWSSEFTKRDLVELLSALEYLGPILNAVGKYAPFSVLVAFAEKTLNVSLPNAYKIREEVLNRKTKSTDFLERLIDALIEKSAK